MTSIGAKSSRRTALGAAIGTMIIVVCLLLTCAIAAIGAETDKTVLQNGSDVLLDETYETGTEYTLPSGIAIADGSSQYDASVILRDPDGNGFTAEKVTLDKAGMYTLEYRASGENGKLLMAKQRFNCYHALFELSSPRSSAEYVESTALHSGIKGGAGISMAIAKGDIFTYNQVLDLSDKTRNDKILSFYVAPETLYDYDAGQINFVLTDAFDRDNSVTISVKRTLLYSVADMQHYSYVTANATSQPATGINQPVQSQYPSVTVDGEQYSLHVSNAYGRAVPHSMYGGYSESKDEASYLGKQMSLSFDYESKRVYAWGINDTSPRLVADLDDPAMFENPWNGFNGGRVILSVNMSSYRTLTSHVVLTRVGDDDLTADFASDRLAPTVTVDLKGYSRDNLPAARVGDAYPLFEGFASDETDGEVICDVSVWYNYSSEETRTRVSTNGKSFVPEKAGDYTVVYSASDRSGNVRNETFDIVAENLDEFELAYVKGPESVAAGSAYAVSGVTLSGGSGNKTLAVWATLQSDDSVRYELVSNGAGNYSFVPLYEGKYDVTFEYSDWLEQKTETELLTVTAATSAYIPSEASVPRYVLAGATYDLPELYGYVFSSAPELKACSASITGGEISGDAFRVSAESGNITLTYKLSYSGAKEATKVYEIPVIAGSGVDGEARTLDMTKLFTESEYAVAPSNYIRKDFSCELTSSDFNGRPVFTAINTDKTAMTYASIDYVNKVLASRFKTRFALVNTEFGRVVIYVTDSANPTEQIKISYINGGSWQMNFSVNDGYVYSTSYKGTSTVDLSFDAVHNTVSTDSITAPVSTYLSGEEFRGFTSGYVYVTYQIEGIYTATDEVTTRTAAIRIDSLNNQTFSGNKTDTVDPEVTEYISKGDLAVNTVTEIPAFAVCDVINPYSHITVSVTAPSGQTVTSVDGVLLDGTQDISRSYEILLSEYGSYSLSVSGFVGKDKNTFNMQYGIQVLDMSAPTVTFINPVTQAKVGDTVAFAGVYVSDDTTDTADIVITAYLMTPNGSIVNVNITEFGSFVAAEAGEYRVIIYACDEGNKYGSATVPNTAIVWYSVTVTA